MSEPKRYRKKPVVIEAMKFLGDDVSRGEQFESAKAIVQWIGELGGQAYSTDSSHGRFLTICTLEGDMHAAPGDFIIKGVSNEFYPCKPDIFAKTYEAVE
jgi:hypothetical protein